MLTCMHKGQNLGDLVSRSSPPQKKNNQDREKAFSSCNMECSFLKNKQTKNHKYFKIKGDYSV